MASTKLPAPSKTRPNPTDPESKKDRDCGRAEQLYDHLAMTREPYLRRARSISALTIPSLFRESGDDGDTDVTVPWQSLGGYGVNVISAKAVMTAFPAGIPFVAFKPSKETKDSLKEMPPTERGQLLAEIQNGLTAVAVEFMEAIEADGDRPILFDLLRHLMVGGTHGLKVDPKDTLLSSFGLDEFVNRRSKTGRLMEFIIKATMEWDELPADVKGLLMSKGYIVRNDVLVQPPVDVFTWGKYQGGMWTVKQETWGEEVPGSRYMWDDDSLPYIFPRLIVQKGEHYGRSWLEDYEGDLQSLDGLWQIMLETASLGAIIKWLIKSGGTTNKETFSQARNGEAITGDVSEVGSVQANKQGDLNAALALASRIEERYKLATLQNSGVQRDGERVTGIEIKYVAQELEATLGGVWSNLVATVQRPYALRKLKGYQKTKRVTELPKKAVSIDILTGDRALGRQEEGMQLDEFITTAGAALGGPQALAPYVNVETYLRRGAAARLIDPEGLVNTQEDVDAKQQQALMAQTMSNVAPNVVDQVGQMGQTAQQGEIDAGLAAQQAALDQPPAAQPQAPAPAPAQ